MTVFPFPPDFPGLSVPFSVVGFDWDSGAPDGELLILPSGCEARPLAARSSRRTSPLTMTGCSARRTPRRNKGRSGWRPSARAGRSAAA